MLFRWIVLPVLVLALLGGGALYLGWAPAGVAGHAEEARASLDETITASAESIAERWFSGEGSAASGGDYRRSQGAALALAIRAGRRQAEADGAEPVPDRLKRQFRGHFAREVLNKARWIVAAPDSRLGRILARWPVEEGAVTLGHVIVFKTQDASRNRRLFAHELEHVRQYEELGIDGFAQRYAADPDPLEEQARRKARRVARSL